MKFNEISSLILILFAVLFYREHNKNRELAIVEPAPKITTEMMQADTTTRAQIEVDVESNDNFTHE